MHFRQFLSTVFIEFYFTILIICSTRSHPTISGSKSAPLSNKFGSLRSITVVGAALATYKHKKCIFFFFHILLILHYKVEYKPSTEARIKRLRPQRWKLITLNAFYLIFKRFSIRKLLKKSKNVRNVVS